MSWKYGLVKQETPDGYWYSLTEIYDKQSYSEGFIHDGESPEEIIADLKMMISDLENNLLIIKEIV